MSRRSRPQPRQAAARPNFQRYLFPAALVFISLAFPAALTLVGRRPPQQTDGDPSADGMWTISPEDGRLPANAEPVSPQIWRGIVEGIPPTPRSAEDIHVVFSTDCSPYQNYQAIMLFNSAEVWYASDVVIRARACCCPCSCTGKYELGET